MSLHQNSVSRGFPGAAGLQKGWWCPEAAPADSALHLPKAPRGSLGMGEEVWGASLGLGQGFGG